MPFGLSCVILLCMKAHNRKQKICAILAAVLSLSFMLSAAAMTWDDRDANGIISYKEEGELIAAIQNRLRELGYFIYKPTGRYQSMTRLATIEFQKNQTDDAGNQIISDGTIGEQTLNILFSNRAVRANIPIEVHIPIGKKADGSQKEKGELLAWETVKMELEAGKSYSLMDYNTGVTFSMKYTGGEAHAEMECPDAANTAIYKDVFGDAFNYSKRPMLIKLNDRYVACSLQGEPHGEDTVAANDMTGHACLYFYNSKSHVGNLTDVEHVNNVYAASGQ